MYLAMEVPTFFFVGCVSVLCVRGCENADAMRERGREEGGEVKSGEAGRWARCVCKLVPTGLTPRSVMEMCVMWYGCVCVVVWRVCYGFFAFASLSLLISFSSGCISC